MTRPVRVLVVQEMLPEYRVPVFAALGADPRIELLVAFGEPSRLSAMQNAEGSLPFGHVRLKNMFLPREVAWIQGGLLRAFDQARPDVVVLPLNPRNLSLGLLEARARRRGASVVRWGHGIRPSGRMRNLYAAMVMRSDRTILYYPQAANDLVAAGVPAEKLTAAWNSIDTVTIGGLAQPYDEGRDTVLCIGRMIPAKKTPLLVRAFIEAKGRGLPSRLEVIGSGPDMAQVEAMVAGSGCSDEIVLRGSVYGEAEIAEVMNRSFLSVCPGYVGLNAVHSLAYGVPMLYADPEPHSPEIIAFQESGTELSFRSDDASDLAGRLIELEGDRARLAQLSAHGQEYVMREFSAERMAKNIADTIVGAFEGFSRPVG